MTGIRRGLESSNVEGSRRTKGIRAAGERKLLQEQLRKTIPGPPLDGTAGVHGGRGRIPQRRCSVTLHPSRGTRDGYPVRPPPGILPLQAGIVCGQLSPDYSRVLRE